MVNTIVETPGPLDILCGRGLVHFQHEGNARFRMIIACHVGSYQAAKSKPEKSKKIRSLTEEIRESGCRFLKRSKKTGNKWTVVGAKEEYEKISHALRDACSNKVRCMKEMHQNFSEASTARRDKLLKALKAGKPTDMSGFTAGLSPKGNRPPKTESENHVKNSSQKGTATTTTGTTTSKRGKKKKSKSKSNTAVVVVASTMPSNKQDGEMDVDAEAETSSAASTPSSSVAPDAEVDGRRTFLVSDTIESTPLRKNLRRSCRNRTSRVPISSFSELVESDASHNNNDDDDAINNNDDETVYNENDTDDDGCAASTSDNDSIQASATNYNEQFDCQLLSPTKYSLDNRTIPDWSCKSDKQSSQPVFEFPFFPEGPTVPEPRAVSVGSCSSSSNGSSSGSDAGLDEIEPYPLDIPTMGMIESIENAFPVIDNLPFVSATLQDTTCSHHDTYYHNDGAMDGPLSCDEAFTAGLRDMFSDSVGGSWVEHDHSVWNTTTAAAAI